MKVTNDRLAVAGAVQEHIEFLTGESFDLYPEEVIESLPEPPDDSPATLPDENHDCQWRRDADARAEDKVLHLSAEPLPAPTGPDMCAHNAAHKSEWWWARERKTRLWHMARVAFPRPSPKGDDVLIASPISGFSNTLRNRGDFDAWLPLVAPTAKGGE